MLSAIIAWILLFLFLVVVHELWHFIAAKKSGVAVQEFGIWIPPRAFTYYVDNDWTEYTVNWLPLWGFVRIKWENPEDPDSFYANDSFITQNIFKKIIILVAGVAMNVLFAWLFFSIAFWQWTQPISVLPDNFMPFESESLLVAKESYLEEQWYTVWERQNLPIEVEMVLEDELADDIGIKTWDIITHIDWQEVGTLTLQTVLAEKLGEEFEITVTREVEIDDDEADDDDEVETETETIDKEAECPSDRCFLWIMMSHDWVEILPIKFDSFGEAASAWRKEVQAQTHLTFNILRIIWEKLLEFDREKAKEAAENVAWPVGAVKIWETILEQHGFRQYLAFGGMLSLALAIFNILPIPALDWGRAVSILIQTIFRIKPDKYFIIEWYVNLIFFVLLMALWIYIIFQDLDRFWDVTLMLRVFLPES